MVSAPDSGDCHFASSIFLLIDILLVGRLRRSRPSAGNLHRNGKMEIDQMLNWLKPKFNTGNILPEIENMLQRFDYGGLTNQDDPINRIALDIMMDDFNKSILGKAYINIYQFKVHGKQFYLCDRAMHTSVETRRHVCILAADKSFPLGFEITTDDYFINNDCESVEIIGQCDVRVEQPDEYDVYKSFLTLLLPHCEKFATSSNPVSFFSFPQDNILGYHASGREIASDEADSAVSLLQRFP
jgi:hypothetical protein